MRHPSRRSGQVHDGRRSRARNGSRHLTPRFPERRGDRTHRRSGAAMVRVGTGSRRPKSSHPRSHRTTIRRRGRAFAERTTAPGKWRTRSATDGRGTTSATRASGTTSSSSEAASAASPRRTSFDRPQARTRASSCSTTTTTSAGTPSGTSSRAGGRMWIGYGGTQAIEGRRSWSAVAKGLRDELGIDTDKFFTAVDQKLYTSLGLGQGVFFDRETWGVDRLVKGGQGNGAEGPAPPAGWWREFAANAPFTGAARRDFIRVHEEKVDYLPGLTRRAEARPSAENQLSRLSARLRQGRRAGRCQYFQQRTHSGWGVGHRRRSRRPVGAWLGGISRSRAPGAPQRRAIPTSSISPTATPPSPGCSSAP